MNLVKIAAALVVCGAMSAAVWAGEVIHKVGKVTWHAADYAGKAVALKGYLLEVHDGYVLFSDEPNGGISAHDLPVSGAGSETMVAGKLYLLHGTFLKGGLTASNGNPYHLALSVPPAVLP